MPNRTEIRAFFSGRVDREIQNDFDQEEARSNMRVAGWALPIVFLMELFNIVFVLFFTRRGLESPGNRLYFGLYVSLAVVTLLFYLLLLWLR